MGTSLVGESSLTLLYQFQGYVAGANNVLLFECCILANTNRTGMPALFLITGEDERARLKKAVHLVGDRPSRISVFEGLYYVVFVAQGTWGFFFFFLNFTFHLIKYSIHG